MSESGKEVVERIKRENIKKMNNLRNLYNRAIKDKILLYNFNRGSDAEIGYLVPLQKYRKVFVNFSLNVFLNYIRDYSSVLNDSDKFLKVKFDDERNLWSVDISKRYQNMEI